MIRQDDVLLNSISELPFEDCGCALFDIQYLAVMHGDNTFVRSHFVEMCDNWIMAKVLDHETAILNWDRIAQDSGLPYRLVFEDGIHKLNPLRKLKENELQLLYLYNPETKIHHFVVGDENDNVVYDSLGSSRTVEAYKRGVGYIESRRVFRRIR